MRMKWSMLRTFGPEIILFSVILFIVEFIRGAMLVSFLPIYGEKQLGLSLDIIGIAITAHYLTDTALKLGIGYLLDRFSIRFIIHVGLLSCLLGVFLFHFAELPWIFITAAALYGIGISPIWIVCLTKVSEQNRATQMGYLYTIWLVGIGAGPIVCNILLDINREFTFYLLLALSAIAWFMSLFISNARTNDVQTIPFRKQLSILKERLVQMKLLLPGMILQTAGAGMLVPILPSFAENRLGFTSTQYSLLLMVGGVCTVALLMPMGRLSDKLDAKKWFLVLGFGIFAAALYLLTFGPSLWLCLVLAAILGISYSAVLPAWNALLAAYVPAEQKGLGWGVFSTVEGIGVMIGPVLGGVIALWHGEGSVVWISSLLFGCIALFYVFFSFRTFRN